jgi:hypothetical protein
MAQLVQASLLRDVLIKRCRAASDDPWREQVILCPLGNLVYALEHTGQPLVQGLVKPPTPHC